jgi:hypothetical protein
LRLPWFSVSLPCAGPTPPHTLLLRRGSVPKSRSDPSLLLGCKDAIPVLRQSLDLELRNPAPVQVVDGREMARRGEQAVIE